MRVGVPKEIKTHEYRVGLTPGAVREYVHAGHDVVVETGAGAGIGAGDDVYRTAGARIAATAAEIFSTADMIVKVKEPQPGEWVQLRPGQILFTYLHLAADPEQARGLIASGCTAIAYETVTDARGGLPLLAPMSEVAGRLAIEAAGGALQRHRGGRGWLATRILLTGASPLHGVLLREIGRIRAEVAAIAQDFGEDAVWIEQIKVATSPVYDLGELAERDALTKTVLETLEQATHRQDALPGDINEMLDVLPPELRAEVETEWSPDQRPVFMKDVRAIILEALRTKGETTP